MNEPEHRGPWYLFTGLVLGLALGLGYAWTFQPVQYIDTAPVYMRTNFKDEYRALVSVAFMASGNLVRAEKRLDLLQDANPMGELALQAGRWNVSGRPASEVQALAALAALLLESASQTAEPVPPQVLSTPTLTATPPPPNPTVSTPNPPTQSVQQATLTPLPTRTPTATPGGAFALQDQNLLCDTDPGAPLIVFNILDASGNPVPGMEIRVTWSGGEERFFTGLKPEFGLGYADFTMTPGVRYTIQLLPSAAAGGQPVNNLEASECETDGKRFWGVWKLNFVQR